MGGVGAPRRVVGGEHEPGIGNEVEAVAELVLCGHRIAAENLSLSNLCSDTADVLTLPRNAINSVSHVLFPLAPSPKSNTAFWIEVFGSMSHAVAFALHQPAQQGHGETGMIDVRIAGDKDDVDRLPASCRNFFHSHRKGGTNHHVSRCREEMLVRQVS